MVDISIIIVNYNVKEFLKNLLESLKKATTELTSEIIVVDNASSDGSVEEISLKFPEVNLIVNNDNVGFGTANNQALKITNGKYLLMINPDTIVREDTFTTLIKFFEERPEAGIVGCKVLNPDGTLQLACRRSFPGPWTSLTKVTGLSSLFPKSKLFARYNLTYLDESEVNEVDAISGAFMMMKRDVYEKVGGFDQLFFMYGEDLDLCYRIQSAGYKVYYVPDSEIIHYKGESTKRSSLDETKLFYDAMHLFVKKHFSSFFIVEWILRSAIFFRKIFAFLNIYKLPIISAVTDFVFVSFAYVLAEYLYQKGTWAGFPEEVKPWVYIVPAFIQILISAIAENYKKDTLSILRTIISLIIGLVVLSSATFFLKQFAFSRAVILISYVILLFVLPFWRLLVKTIFKIGLSFYSGKNSTLIVSRNDNGSALAKKLKSNFTQLYNIKGFICDDQKLIGNKIEGYDILGSISNIKKVISEYSVNKVIFNSTDISFDKMFSVVAECQGMNVEFLVVGQGQEFLVGKSEVTLFDDLPLMKVNYNISSYGHRMIKNIFDLSLSWFTFIALYPFVFIYSKMVKNYGDFVNFALKIPSVLFLRKSFVGPKKKFSIDNLFVGKIGLTGLWYTESVSPNDEEDFKRINLYYAKNQNIWLDLEILGKSLSKMFLKSEK